MRVLNLRLFVDSGSEVSILKEHNQISFNSKQKSKLLGIDENPVYTLGSRYLDFSIANISLKQKFHFVKENFPIPFDGILGLDFIIKYRVKLDLASSKFSLVSNDKEFEINFEGLNNDKLPSVLVIREEVVIPPRSENFVNLKTGIDFDFVCKNSQLFDGVFVGNSICRAKDNSVVISVINSLSEPVSLKNINLEIEPLESFNVLTISIDQDDRFKVLEESLSLKSLNFEEREQILRLCSQYDDIFYLTGDKLTYTDAVKHHIPLIENAPVINVKPYRLPISQRGEIKRQIDKLIADDIVVPSKSPFNSPLLIVPKKLDADGQRQWRVVVDFRRLNELTCGDSFPLPNISDILDQLGQSKYFSTLDLASGYHQVLVGDEDRYKTAFSTTDGHYEFARMPFGLKTAPATFQRMMNTILLGLNGVKCFVYLDDIVVYGKCLAEHIERLEEVFDRIRQFNLKLNPSKCYFLSKDVAYLGHRITTDGIFPDQSKIQCILDYPTPKDIKGVRTFLGFCGYYRRFISNFAALTKPLNNLLKKDSRFCWDDAANDSFLTLKRLLSNPPILQYPDFDRAFILTTDASGEAIGSVLSQGKPGEDLPIAYASRMMNKHEKNYSVSEKELLAITWSVKHFRPYLFGKKFTIYCDHKPLTYLMSVRDPSSRLLRFRLKLDEYDYEIIHKPGKINTNADALSRAFPIQKGSRPKRPVRRRRRQRTPDPTTSISEIDLSNTVVDNSVNLTPFDLSVTNKSSSLKDNVVHSNINSLQKQNKRNRYVNSERISQSQNKSSVNCDKSVSFLDSLSKNSKITLGKSASTSFQTSSEPAYREFIEDSKDPNSVRRILPTEDEIPEILRECHDSPTGGHQGVLRTFKRIKTRYAWPGMLSDISRYVKKCPKCQVMKPSASQNVPMTITTTSTYIFEKVFMDIVGPLPLTPRNNRYLLTVQDDLSKFLVAVPIPNQESQTIAEAFSRKFICNYGVPKIIQTDQGSNFVSRLFKHLCKTFGITKINSTAYRPQSQGCLERTHRTVKEYLRSFVDRGQKDWDLRTAFACFSFNTAVSSSTEFTPFELVYGQTCRLPSSIMREPVESVDSNRPVEALLNALRETTAIARENQIFNKIERKLTFDKKCKTKNFQVGDLVLLKNEQITPDLTKKLMPCWVGPYEIITTSPTNSKIIVNGRPVLVHNSRLKKYNH